MRMYEYECQNFYDEYECFKTNETNETIMF